MLKLPTLAILITLLLIGCAGHQQPSGSATHKLKQLTPCPTTPNCASTDQTTIEAPVLVVAPALAWPEVIKAVKSLPGTTLTYQEGYQLRAESRSWLFRFTDDLELYLDTDTQQLMMRSASRLGYSDLGVNADRLEKLTELLRSQGIVK